MHDGLLLMLTLRHVAISHKHKGLIMADTLGQKILLRQSKMECIRRDYEQGIWVDITRLGNPRREDICDEDKANLKGQRKGRAVYDGTALGSLNIWSDGMQGFLLSGSWFRSEMSNPELNEIDSVRNWLQVYDRKMYAAWTPKNGTPTSPLTRWQTRDRLVVVVVR